MGVKKDKLKGLDIRYFLLPLFCLIIIFAALTYFTLRNRVNERYRFFENEALSIADSYSHALVYSHEAYDIISELLSEKLIVASQAVMLINGNKDNEFLSELADRFLIDDIFCIIPMAKYYTAMWINILAGKHTKAIRYTIL